MKFLWTGVKQFFNFSKKGFCRWGAAIMNPENLNSLNGVTEFMKENPQFWGVLSATGILVAKGYKVYESCPKFKKIVDNCYSWGLDLNESLKGIGIDLADFSYSYTTDVSKLKLDFKGSSLNNLKTDFLYERVITKINDERGNILRFYTNFNISGDKENCCMDITISFSFNSRYREKNYEEILSNFDY